MTSLTIWLIGYLFTVGLISDDSKISFSSELWLFFIWPLILGKCANEIVSGAFNKSDNSNGE